MICGLQVAMRREQEMVERGVATVSGRVARRYSGRRSRE